MILRLFLLSFLVFSGAIWAQTKLSDAEIVAKANDFLNNTRFMSADFVQIGQDGQRSEGQFVMQRPGHMLLRYKPPVPLEIIADGQSVAVRDSQLGTQDLYLIGQTPLKFLLLDHVDLGHDTKIVHVSMDMQAAKIALEDSTTLGGSSEITLVFDPETFELRQWTVIDPQGFRTEVSLLALDLITKPDPQSFVIDTRMQPNQPRHR